MGWQPEKYDAWNLSGDNELAGISPGIPGASSLFQRLVRQRAAYFADVEDGSGDGECLESVRNQSGVGGHVGMSQAGREDAHQLPSGFADLSTWCCDAFSPSRPTSGTLEKRSAAWISLADQPTMILPLLGKKFVHLADIPTVPMLLAVNSPEADAPHSDSLTQEAERKRSRGWLCRCRRFLWTWLRGICLLRRSQTKTRRSAWPRHASFMQRLRAREKKSQQPETPFPSPEEKCAGSLRELAERAVR